jgi:hypothetical protein
VIRDAERFEQRDLATLAVRGNADTMAVADAHQDDADLATLHTSMDGVDLLASVRRSSARFNRAFHAASAALDAVLAANHVITPADADTLLGKVTRLANVVNSTADLGLAGGEGVGTAAADAKAAVTDFAHARGHIEDTRASLAALWKPVKDSLAASAAEYRNMIEGGVALAIDEDHVRL